jgi:PAS domain S-box-containing protein
MGKTASGNGTAHSASPSLPRAQDETWPNEEASARLLLESIHDFAIYMLDRRGRIASWNAGAERIKGYAAPEILGKHFSTFYLPDDQAAGEPLRRLLAAVDGQTEDEGWRVRKDGRRFWASAVITPMRNRAGALIGFANVTREVIDPRRREEPQRAKLLRAEDALKRRADFVSRANRSVNSALLNVRLHVHALMNAHHTLPGDGTFAKLDPLDGELDRLAILIEETLRLAVEVDDTISKELER